MEDSDPLMEGPEFGALPIAAAIRNWGAGDEAFIAFDWHIWGLAGPELTGDVPFLLHYFCSDNDVCHTPSTLSLNQMGEYIYFQNAVHPALGISRASATSSIKARLLARQDAGDCDNDGDDAFDLLDSEPERQGLDLWAFSYDSFAGYNSLTDARLADSGTAGVCENHGYSRARTLSGVIHTCFTFDTDPVTGINTQKLACNNNSGTSISTGWANHVDLSNAAGATVRDEDHPSFDFVGGSTRAVLGHWKNGPTEKIRLHVLGATEAISDLDSASTDMNNPDIVEAANHLHAVWARGSGASAGIVYRDCVRAGAVTCETASDWTVMSSVADNTMTTAIDPDDIGSYVGPANSAAKFPQLAVDGENQFVVYQIDTDTAGGFKTRVMVASRCEGDGWTVEQVRTPDDLEWDQSIAFGRPSIVVNADEHYVQVVFVELDDYQHGFDFGNAQDGGLYWYRKGYTPCGE